MKKRVNKSLILFFVILSSLLFVLNLVVSVKHGTIIIAMLGVVNCFLFFVTVTFVASHFRLSRKKAATDVVTGISGMYAFNRKLKSLIKHNEEGNLAIVRIEGLANVSSVSGRGAQNEILHVIAVRMKDACGDKARVYKLDGPEYAIIYLNRAKAAAALNTAAEAGTITPAAVNTLAEAGTLTAKEAAFSNTMDSKSVISAASDEAGGAGTAQIADTCYEIYDKIIKQTEMPVTIKKGDILTNFYVTAYMGCTQIEKEDTQAEEIIKRADIALSSAAKSNNDRIVPFGNEMREQIGRDIRAERLTKESLKKGYFYLVYQPQYTTADKRLRGFETLIRMATPDGDKLAPSEFIDVAERSDLILEIDDFVLRRAMVEFREICFATGNTITLAVNVSAKDIARGGFANMLLEIIEEIKFPAECLEVEITEYSFAGAQNHTIENILKLRENQIMIALDDFGTGYTSLEQLMKLPVNLVKLDKSLVDNVARQKINRDFVKSVIYMGHLMDAEVIAEGVEYDEQLNVLRELDCDFTQGYLWGRPMEYAEARELALGACGSN